MSATTERVGPLAQRAILRTFRQPPLLVQGIVFPLFLFAFTVGGLGKIATQIPGFPTSSYSTFALALTFTYSALFATVIGGAALGEDIRSGFVTRTALTATSGVAIVLGQLSGVVVFAVFQSVIYLVVGLAAGASIAAGAGGALVMILLAALGALAFGSLGMLIAQKTRSPEAVQGLLPLLTVFMFLSSMSLPRDLITTSWVQTVASFNPISYVIEGQRSLLVTGWDGHALGYAAAIAVAILVPALFATVSGLRAASVAR
jgi:ABC-2 type transport system permease protein